MSNHITIEFCAEDRERIDRLTEALERNACGQPTETDPLQAKLAEVVANAKGTKATETPQEPQEAETLADTPAKEETPTEAKDAPAEEPKPTVTLEQIQQKVVQLAAGYGGAKKAKVREIINAYAQKVSDLPADKWGEVWDKLTALEQEG